MTRELPWSAVAFIALAVSVVLGLVFLTGRTIRRKEGGVKAATTGLLAILIAALSYLMLGGMWGIGGDHDLTKAMSSVAVLSLLGVGAIVALWLVSLTILSVVRREGGWTITANVLWTLFIVWIVGALTFPMFAHGGPPPPHRNARLTFNEVRMALMLYVSDHDEYLPIARDDSELRATLVPYYLEDHNSWEWESDQGRRTVYFNFALTGQNFEKIPNPERMPMLYDHIPYPDGKRLVACADGQAIMRSEEEWLALFPKIKTRKPDEEP